MGKIGYAICTNCGCNETSVEIYRCQSCRKMYCKKCAHVNDACPDLKCENKSLDHKGYILPYDEVEETHLM